MPDQSVPSPMRAQSLFVLRLVIGLLQGIALYFLYLAVEEKIWPATNGLVFAPMLIVSLFVPLIAIQAIGTMRIRTFILWLISATLVLVALAFYEIWHAWPVAWSYDAGLVGWVPHIIPSFFFFVSVIASLFITHTLIVGGDGERKFRASYPTYFDVAWKHGIQVALTVAFTGVFWAFLWLGASLFEIIKLTFLTELLKREWFSIPVTALAVAGALHISDVNAGLIRGARTLALTLLSWLLPLLALLIFGFLVALPFTGIELLWSTKSAAALMLSSAAIMLILINAVYQDGAAERAPHAFLRYVTLASMFAPVPLTALAAYAIGLRVQQYGWTSERVLTFACVITAAFYAIGYVFAALRRGAWLKTIEVWNFCAALFILAVMFLLLTPIADPMRIGVSSQMARFERGIVDAATLDVKNLRWDGGRFGKAALERLLKYDGEDSALMHENVQTALNSQNEYGRAKSRPNTKALERNITLLDKDQVIPESFFKQDWSSAPQSYLPDCLEMATGKCTARIVDLNKDGQNEIILSSFGEATALGLDGDGQWKILGAWHPENYCQNTNNQMNKGKFEFVAPLPNLWPDIMLGGQRLRFSPPPTQQGC